MRLSLMLLLAAIAISAKAAPVSNGLFINEFMASNSNTYADAAGEYEDWIEIYNAGTEPADLAGYYITDDLTNLVKVPLTTAAGQLVVPAGGFLIIWGGGNTSLGANHIDIGLSAGGESLALVQPDGLTVVDSFIFPAQKPDIPMGRTVDGAGEWRFLNPATPMASNNTSVPYAGFLNPPVFSRQGGVFTDSFKLQISAIDTGASIIYTLDGSEPAESAITPVVYRYKNNYKYAPTDPTGEFLYDSTRTYAYTDSLLIRNRTLTDTNRISMKSSTFDANPGSYTPLVNIRKANVVRARVIKPGYMPSPVVMQSYFAEDTSGKAPHTLPVFSLGIPENYLFNWDSGIYNAGTDFEQWRALKPTTPANIAANANFERKSEFPISLEYFAGGTGNRLFYHNCGFRINGNGSRFFPRKALRLYFKSDYGEPNIGYPVFPDKTATDYQRLILRNGGNEPGNPRMTTTMRDMSLQAIVKGLKCDTQDGTPSIVYLNGEYWGLHDLRERIDRVYFESKYGIPEGELDLLENGIADEGDDIHYKAMINYVEENDLTQPAVYDSVVKLVDIDNYIDYQIAEVFLDNTDWPNNNTNFYRKRIPFDPTAPAGADGRWRWVVKDIDKGFANRGGHDNLRSALSPNWGRATSLTRQLMTNPIFRQQFIIRYADLLNTMFLPANTRGVIASFRQKTEPEIREHIQRWRDPVSYQVWDSNVNVMMTFGTYRPAYARTHIQVNLNVAGQQNVTVNVNSDSMGIVKVNTIDIDSSATPGVASHPYPWSGIYFLGVPVQFTPKAKDGYHFVRWEGDTTTTADTLILIPDTVKAINVVAIFEKDSVISQPQIVHYWHFNNLPSGNLDSLLADSSVIGGTLITYPGTGAGYMDRTNATEGSDINAQYAQPAGQALRVRNPSDVRALVFNTPTTGFKNVKISYAAQRTGSGAQYQRISYSANSGTNWTLVKDSLPINEAFELQSFDLKDSAGTANNASLLFRIEFLGTNAPGASGNNRFDNFLVTGIPDTVPSQIVHYWHFNNLPSGNLDSLLADSSAIGGTLITYPGTGAGYMDRTNATEGADINAQYAQPAGQALRVRNPSDTRALVFNTPTTGFKNIKISYAAQRTGSGAQYQRISYSANSGTNWTLVKDSLPINEAFELQSFDLKDSAGTANNASLLFRIEFLGTNAPGTSGNNRFDNFLVTGIPDTVPSQIVHYWHFNNLPSGNLDSLLADSSVIGGTLITYPGTGAGYMDRTNATEGSDINAQYAQPAGQALRVRNPSDTRALVFNTPTTGFKNVKISYAAQRTGSGAQFQRISYSANSGADWTLVTDTIPISEAFELQSFDLKDSVGTANNASLLIKIEFWGTNASGTSGNNRFDNFLVTGIPTPIVCQPGEWTGAADTDWFNAANWCGGIPTITDSVTIRAGKPRYPSLSNTPVTIKALTLEKDAWLTLLSEAILTIEGGACVIKGNVQMGVDSKLDVKQ